MSPNFAARGPRASLRPWYLVGDSFTNNRRRSPSTNAYSPRTPFPGRTTSRGERVRDRDGTDHTNVEERIAAVMEQLDQGTAVIFFDPDNKSCDISLAGKTSPRESQDKL
jgi:hypothetical protein